MLARLGNVFVCFVLLCILSPRVCWADEPESCSRLCYEEKILEKVIRIEMKLEEIERQMQEGKGEQKGKKNVISLSLHKKTGKTKWGYILTRDVLFVKIILRFQPKLCKVAELSVRPSARLSIVKFCPDNFLAETY